MSTTFEQKAPAEPTGAYEYSRSGNPTRAALETALAELEEAQYGLSFPSGLGAMTAILSILDSKHPAHILCGHDVYGGTARMLNTIAKDQFGLHVEYFDFTGDGDVANTIRTKGTKMVWLETMTNPTLQVTDLVKTVKAIRAISTSAIIVVDNTFMTPVLQRPLHLTRYDSSMEQFGADLVTHSVTKYINGHCDVVMGAVMTNRRDLHDRLKFVQNAMGIVPSPFDCYLVLRGIKTLPLRFRKQCANAMQVAQFLQEQIPKGTVRKVYYPGLTAKSILDGQTEHAGLYGAMVSVELNCEPSRVKLFLRQLTLFILAESLGGVESLIEVPALMTHQGLKPEVRLALGITPTFLRLSIGIENGDDLVADLEQAFEGIRDQ